MASTGSCHLGRLAGFTNQKPQPRTITSHAPWVRIVEARAVLASAAQDLLRCATQVQAQLPNHAMNRLFPGSNPSSAITVQAATRIYQRWMQHWHIRERFAQPDWSIVDLWLARKLLAMHISPAQVTTILRLGSPHVPRQHGDPENYLRRTLARAALPPPRTVCSSHATAPLLPDDETDKDFSNSHGGR
ncbi:MAG TPA: DNA-primase RepB domain-containing protein [Candidatus Sulfotelmatobacter sp.]|nr:DNA-primase RepB domain-containing protein [Candidatus Sulfotelmatobacter sp.]